MLPSMLLLASLMVLFCCSAHAATSVPADSIGVPCDSLPEFKTDPHERGSQGNQISGVVRVMLKDERGDIWFGTQDGIIRYDGTKLICYDVRDVRGHTVTVRAMAQDRAGGSGGSALDRYHCGRVPSGGRRVLAVPATRGDKARSRSRGLESVDRLVHDMTQDRSGNLWVNRPDFSGELVT